MPLTDAEKAAAKRATWFSSWKWGSADGKQL